MAKKKIARKTAASTGSSEVKNSVAHQKAPANKSGKPASDDRIILRTGEALIEADPAWSAAEPEVVIGELDGPVGYAIANLIPCTTASTSSAFICNTGHSVTLATSVQ